MQAVVHVTLKKTVLDPQGRTILGALNNLGYRSVADVRQGKFFEIDFDADANPTKAREEVERIAHEVLANPVIEDFEIEIHE